MHTFNLNDLASDCAKRDSRWSEFLRVDSLSMGIYRLKAGQPDEQKPHSEDEVYLVISGRANFQAGDEQQTAGPGTLIFVERLVEHRFFDITEDLAVLVFFAPAERSG